MYIEIEMEMILEIASAQLNLGLIGFTNTHTKCDLKFYYLPRWVSEKKCKLEIAFTAFFKKIV